MSTFELKYRPFGTAAVLIDWPVEISPQILQDICAFQKVIEENPFLGWQECIPAYASLTIIYDPQQITYEAVLLHLQRLATQKQNKTLAGKCWDIPVCYDTKFGLDLEALCQAKGLSQAALIALHGAQPYWVHFIGFLPGFLYLGGLPEALHHPRRSQPRPRIPAGSVGIGGAQTGVYPHESPGGWQIIGRSPIQWFTLEKDPPCFAQAGDQVQFYAIDRQAYEQIKLDCASGQFQLKSRAL